jgi:3-hydroxyacyl-[acyl-carrier-protein] dehydratase
MTVEVRRVIRADHPSLPGHFPGAPLVPGVVILDEVLAAVRDSRTECELTAIRRVKFLYPLKPDQAFTICFSAIEPGASEVSFSCRLGDRVIVEGEFELCAGTNVTS